MGAFFDGLTAFGQPLTIAAVLMRIGVAVVIGAVIGIDPRNQKSPGGHTHACAGVRRRGACVAD